MPAKTALLDYNKCKPDECEGGVCRATLKCPLHLIKQEEPYGTPMADPFSCKGCGTCVVSCPVRAFAVVRI